MIGGECSDPAAESLLGAYVLGRLDRAEAVATRGHLARCPACRESVASLRTVAIALRLLQPADVADLADLDAVDLGGPQTAEASEEPSPPVPSMPATVGQTRCRFDLALGTRDHRRPRPLPSTGRG